MYRVPVDVMEQPHDPTSDVFKFLSQRSEELDDPLMMLIHCEMEDECNRLPKGTTLALLSIEAKRVRAR